MIGGNPKNSNHGSDHFDSKCLRGNLPGNLSHAQGSHHWKTWRKFQEDLCDARYSGTETEMYRITQDTFRKLTKQVEDTRIQLDKKNTGCGLKSYHPFSPCLKSAVIYSSQLAASLSHKPASIAVNGISAHGDHLSVKNSHVHHRPQSNYIHKERDRPPPRTKSSLSSPEYFPVSEDFSCPEQTKHQNTGPFEIIAKSSQHANPGCSVQGESSVEGLSISKTGHDTLMQRLCKLEDLQKNVELMKISEDAGQESGFSSIEPDPIPDALSEPFCYMDLLELSQGGNWRKAVRRVPSEKDEEMIMDRLIELEQLQLETSKLESQTLKRNQSVIEERRGWNKGAARPTERAWNMLNRKEKSRNCYGGCLRLSCAGYCPVDATEEGGTLCRGECHKVSVDYGYRIHARKMNRKAAGKDRPKSCQSCVRRPGGAVNALNTQNVILGRPRSAFSTFSSTQQINTVKKTTHTSEQKEILKCLKNLEVAAPKLETGSYDAKVIRRRRRIKSAKAVSGRDAMLSGKTYKSQRKKSITTAGCSTSAARLNPPTLRSRSSKKRRV